MARVVLGTRALQDPAWVRQMAQTYPKRIVLGLDARDGKVATHGWLKTSEASVLDVAREFANWPLYAIVYTDIARDGMLEGPNVDGLAELAGGRPAAGDRLRRRHDARQRPRVGGPRRVRLHHRPGPVRREDRPVRSSGTSFIREDFKGVTRVRCSRDFR